MSAHEALASGAPAVVLGAGTNGLGQVRALSMAGVRTFCVAPRDQNYFGARSRHAIAVDCPPPLTEPAKAIEVVLEFGRRQECRPLLLFANDVWLHLGGEHENALHEVFVIPQSPWSLLGRVLNKHTLHQLAQDAGTPAPHTQLFPHLEDIAPQIASLPFPCVLKLEVDSLERLPLQLRTGMQHRVTRYENQQELRTWLEKAHASEFNSPALIQEYIPGGPEALYTLTSYTNHDGKLLAGAVGHKIRQYPPTAGGITVGRIKHVEAVFNQGADFLASIGFHGLANTEFKFDKRDGSYRLMEINPRLGLWNGSVLFAGLNLPAIAYADMQFLKYPGPAYVTSADGTLWLDTIADGLNCIRDYRVTGYPEYDMGLWRWLQSIRGPKVDAVWRWNDPVPGLCYWSGTFIHRTRNALKNLGERL